MYVPVRQLTKAGARSCQRFSRFFSVQSNLVSSSNLSSSREELHKLALRQNEKHHKETQREFEAETDIAMTVIPRDIRFDHRDSVELRDWKRRQQFYYSLEQRYGYLNDALAKAGYLDQKALDERKEWIKQRLKSRKWISDESRKTSVSLRALALVQREYGVPSELLIGKEDSIERKQEKVKEQIQFWMKQTSESLDALPNDRKSVIAAIKEAKQAKRADFRVSQEDIELFLLEHEEELKSELEWDDDKFMEYALHAKKVAARAARERTVETLVKTGPLEKLQLIAPNTLENVEHALRVASEMMTKRTEEYELRFGGMPLEIENDPYELEYEAQTKFLKENRASIKAAKSTKLSSEAESDGETAEEKSEIAGAASESPAAESEAKAEETTGAVATQESDGEINENQFDEEDLLERSESDEEDPALGLYAANRNPLTFMSHPDEDGEEWPRIVDGIDLSNPKIQRIRDFDYDAFEEAPSALEVRIMDAFAVQRQQRYAKQHNITLIPRVHIPDSPADRSLIAKTLLMYRISAIRNHIHKLKEEAKVAYDREYRDISKLNLRIPYDAVNPWKQDFFDQVELVLKNQGSWTTGQKETCLKRLHGMLTDETFSAENQAKTEL